MNSSLVLLFSLFGFAALFAAVWILHKPLGVHSCKSRAVRNVHRALEGALTLWGVVLAVQIGAAVFAPPCSVGASCAGEARPRVAAEAPLALWRADAPARTALVSFVEAVTDPASPDFIPEAERIAVFDLDGTLFCETDPNYFDYMLLAHRVLDDESYRDRASDFEKEVARKITEQNATGAAFKGLETDHGRAVASSFKGMTPAAFEDYVAAFKSDPMPSFDGMTRGEGFYRPMLEIVDYLEENGFTVYVVSGTDRFIVRALLRDSPLALPPRQIIGSDESVVAARQGDAPGLRHTFAQGDEVVFGGEFLVKNLKMNKVAVIQQEIGARPVLSFGNSTGDASMANFVLSGNPHKSLAFMLCCDDTARENGNEAKAAKMRALCAENGWIPISMKDDWTTIYGPGVSKKRP